MRTAFINDSDLIRVAEYDPEDHHMWLTFMDGTVYVYDNVDGSIFGGIVGAESIGAKANAFFKTNKGTKLASPRKYFEEIQQGIQSQLQSWYTEYEGKSNE